jgi:type I restriction enzyme M protein
MVDRTRKEFSGGDVEKITRAYHAWRGEGGTDAYVDVSGFCKAASLDEIKAHGYVLTPGRYVGAAGVEEDEVSFAERFASLQANLNGQFAQADQLTANIRTRLACLVGGE